jgi:hypothetical protein
LNVDEGGGGGVVLFERACTGKVSTCPSSLLGEGVGGRGVREKYHYHVMDQFSLLQSSSFQDPGSPSLVHNVLYQNILYLQIH